MAPIITKKPEILLRMRLLIDRERYKSIQNRYPHLEKVKIIPHQNIEKKYLTYKNLSTIPKELWEAFLSRNQVFSPEIIPLDVSMGRNKDNLNNQSKTDSPGASGNIELLKIPTFFHLTPDVIKEHCEKMKKLCTPFPMIFSQFDLEIKYNTYVYAGPSQSYQGSQGVVVTIPFCYYKGSDKEIRKMKLLLGDRYDPINDMIKIISNKFSSRNQNLDHALNALQECILESKIEREFEKIARDSNNLDNIDLNDLINYCNSKKWKRKNLKMIINGKLVRFNRVGFPFIVEIPKLGIRGPFNDPSIDIGDVIYDKNGEIYKGPTEIIVKNRIKSK